jgi:hypothetical protein
MLYGGPALTFEEFKDFKPDIIIGTSLEVTPPLGQYDSDKLLNSTEKRSLGSPRPETSRVCSCPSSLALPDAQL